MARGNRFLHNTCGLPIHSAPVWSLSGRVVVDVAIFPKANKKQTHTDTHTEDQGSHMVLSNLMFQCGAQKELSFTVTPPHCCC